MENWLQFYKHLPYHVDPAAFSLGSFKVDWYSLMYLAGFLVVYGLLRLRIKRGEHVNIKNFDAEKLLELLIWIFVGLLAGARLGYVLFYDLPYFLAHPLAIISPFEATTGEYIGIYGMSYHGGLLGAVAAASLYTRKKKFSFMDLAAFIVPAIPAGYFFGRLGNFFNGELYGRVTGSVWGMYFPADGAGQARYPSQLIEAFLEGILLFFLLWRWRNGRFMKKFMFEAYLAGYGSLRFIGEFFREPDPQIGLIGIFSLGQLMSLGMMAVAGLLVAARRRGWYNKI